MRRHGRARFRTPVSGFTLIELLVVISIIALLVGILLPVIGLARESGRQANCLANQRTIAQGWLISLADRGWIIPDNSRKFFPDELPGWSQVLQEYFPQAPNLFLTGAKSFNACPAIQNRYGQEHYYFPSAPPQRNWGYAFNIWWRDGASGFGNDKPNRTFFNAGKSFDAIRSTSRYPLFVDPCIKPDGPGYFWGHNETPVWGMPWSTPSLGFGQPHGEVGNASFADGSAHSVTREQVMDGATTSAPYRAPFFANH